MKIETITHLIKQIHPFQSVIQQIRPPLIYTISLIQEERGNEEKEQLSVRGTVAI